MAKKKKGIGRIGYAFPLIATFPHTKTVFMYHTFVSESD